MLNWDNSLFSGKIRQKHEPFHLWTSFALGFRLSSWRLVDDETEKEIEEIITQLTCDKDFICYESGFDVLCKAINIPSESYFACMEGTEERHRRSQRSR
jgi:hypothetical protein